MGLKQVLVPFLLCQAAAGVPAQTTSGQIWANFTLDHPKGDRLVFESTSSPRRNSPVTTPGEAST